MNTAISSRGWAVVTGASSGIGREFVVELASRGYRVLAVARRKEQLDSLVQQIQTAGGTAVARVADLRTREGVAVVSQDAARLGNVELLVNNAAVASGGNFGTSPLESELGSIQLNTEALVSLTHSLLPQMIANRKGAIVNIASTVAFQTIYSVVSEMVLDDLSARQPGRLARWTLGLPGMRERVDRFGGKLDFWSEAGAGTEAVLTVPAAVAYAASNGGRFSFLRRKKARA